MRRIRIDYNNIINGPGVRVVLWVTGCNHKCRGCHNPQTWDKNAGLEFNRDDMNQILEYLGKSYVDGITISGGDPLEDFNRDDLCKIIEEIKTRYPDKTIWVYTGYVWEDLCKKLHKHQKEIILKYVDVVVDGVFDEKLKVENQYRGSSNQRFIDVKNTQYGEVVEWKNEFGGKEID